MGDLPNTQRTDAMQIVGNDEQYAMDVILREGYRRACVDALITVQSSFGYDPFPDSYAEITNTGTVSGGGGVRVQIAATSKDATSPDQDAPAVDKTIYVDASTEGDEIAFVEKIVSELNADTNFKASLEAQAVRDLRILYIVSQFRGYFYERSGVGDFSVTAVGDSSVNLGYDQLLIRLKPASLTRDPNFPHRLGYFGISGQVTTVAQEIGKLCIIKAYNATHGNEMNKNGSSTTIEYLISCITDEDRYVKELRFYGSAAGIKFGQFLNKNVPLTNGIRVTIQSDEQTTVLPIIYTTEDFQAEFALGSVNFQFFAGAGLDNFLASFKFDQPFPIKKSGSFTIDDYIKVEIRDDLTAISKLRFLAFGYRD